MEKRNRGILMMACVLSLAIAACRHGAGTAPVTPAPGPGTGTGTGTGGGGGGGGTPTPPDTALCFERDVLPIFKSSCTMSGCHDAASHQDGYVLTDYTNIMKRGIEPGDANDSKIYEAITEDDEDDRMPRPPSPRLQPAQIALIKRWINEGALNRTGCAPLCDSNNFTFAASVKPIFDQNCRGCHNASTAPSGIALDSYAGIQSAVMGGRLLGAINHQPGFSAMPKNGNKLSICQIRQIEKWVTAGAQNN